MIRKIVRQTRGLLRRTGQRTDFTWRYGLNLRPSLSYLSGRRPLTERQTRLLETLNRDGIALTNVDEFLGAGNQYYRELVDTVERLQIEQTAHREAVAKAANDPASKGQKPYLIHLLGEGPIDPETIWFRFVMQKQIVDVVNAYYGMYSSLAAYNVWQTVPTTLAARQSQLWHRDPEDRQIVKVFVYLTDVDDGAGPLHYLPGTHTKGTVRDEPEFLHKDGMTPRSDDSQVSKLVPPERWVKGIGAKGLMAIADTRGLHKGGWTRSKDRVVYVAEFLSPGAGLAGLNTGRFR